MRLEGKRAFITGGGRGIGRAIALKFADAGADVVVAARTRAEIDSVAEEIRAKGRRSLAIPCDVGDSQNVEEAVRRAAGELGGVDVLVANAGSLIHAPLGETTDALWDEVLRVNLNGVFYSFRAAISGMTESGWGRLIAISSVSGKIGGPNSSAYHAAKHGVLGLVRSVALEAAAAGVTVNAICPGFVDTGLVAAFREGLADHGEGGESEEAAMRRFQRRYPHGAFSRARGSSRDGPIPRKRGCGGITGQAYTISCGAIQI